MTTDRPLVKYPTLPDSPLGQLVVQLATLNSQIGPLVERAETVKKRIKAMISEVHGAAVDVELEVAGLDALPRLVHEVKRVFDKEAAERNFPGCTQFTKPQSSVKLIWVKP